MYNSFIYHTHDPIENCYLHGFSDSSLSAYVACIYLKSLSRSGNVFVQFATAKLRVLTVPRVELLGAYILSNLMNTVYESLNVELNTENYYCWVDSQIVLAWIKVNGREFKTFVRNRLNFIRKKVAPGNRHYCQTDENPADVITRISNYNFIENTLFWEGLEYLKEQCFELQLTSNMEDVDNTSIFK